MEEWREIPGFNGRYFASNIGRVKSIDFSYTHYWRGILKTNTVKGRILIQSKSYNGYMRIELSKFIGMKAIPKKYLVHRLVMQSFYGISDLVVNHKDSNRSNNNLNNLEYCTHSENMKHASSKGFLKNREKGRFLKVSKDDIQTIINLRNKGYYYNEIGKIYGCSGANIFNILKKLRIKNSIS
jgi:hypothetical protein